MIATKKNKTWTKELTSKLNFLAKRLGTGLEELISKMSEIIKKSYIGSNDISVSYDKKSESFFATYTDQNGDKKEENVERIVAEIDGNILRTLLEETTRELRKKKNYEIFHPLVGKVTGGSIVSNDIAREYTTVDLAAGTGNSIGYWNISGRRAREMGYFLGKELKFLVTSVKSPDENFPELKQIIVSREGKEFIRKIFELEVTEIKQGIVSIEEIITVPYTKRTVNKLINKVINKVIVRSNDPNVDPLSACIGEAGSRIKNIKNEFLEREIFDLVAYSRTKRGMIFNLFSPVEIISLIEHDESNFTLIIPEYRASLALRSGGGVVKAIKEYLDVDSIHIEKFEDFEKSGDSIVVWNGNISFEEYDRRRKEFLEGKTRI